MQIFLAEARSRLRWWDERPASTRRWTPFFLVLLLAIGGWGGWRLVRAVTAMESAIDPNHLTLPADCTQALVVSAENWSATRGQLQRWARVGQTWKREGRIVQVTLGRAGLAWGRGLNENPATGAQKREGDGKAPAGVFALGTVFGSHAQPPAGCRLPYRQATERDFWVDDAASPDYNQWVRLEAGAPEARWKSFERMLRHDDVYQWGLVVEHNTHPVQSGAGSAIFLHVWFGPDIPTSGCTAMGLENLLELLAWLDPEANPVLVQLPLTP